MVITKKKFIILAVGFVGLIIAAVLFFAFFSGTSLEKNFEVTPDNQKQSAVTFFSYEGKYYSHEKNSISIELYGSSGVFSGLILTPETRVIKMVSGEDGVVKEEVKAIEDIPKGTHINVITSDADPESQNKIVQISYQ